MNDWYGLASRRSDLTKCRSDLTKWRDIRIEFFNGAYWGAVVAGGAAVAVGAVVGGGAVGVGAATGGAVGVATGGAAALGFGMAGGGGDYDGGAFANGSFVDAAYGKPPQERLDARIFGFASGLVVPIAFAVAVGYSVNKYVESNQIKIDKATTPVPANCNRDAVDQEIKKLEDLGFIVRLECK